MNRLIVPTLFACLLGGSTALADDGPMFEVASRAWAVTEAVLARHIEPPTRQEMLLRGVQAMARAAMVATPAGLARRVSDLSGPDQLAALMAEILASPKVEIERARPEDRLPEILPSDGMAPQDAFFDGLGSSVPGGVSLMPEKERKVRESFAANLYVGIQIHLGVDEKSKRPVFLKILEGGPADNAGAKAGDLIEEVDGESTAEKPLSWVVDRLRGAEGTDVLVQFRRPETGEVFTKPMTRGTLPRATVQGLTPLPGKRWATRFDGQAPIGYLKLAEVSGSTPQELRGFAAQLESEGCKALVLDLRETSPAHFHETVLLADALLDGGVIGRVRSTDSEKIYRAEPDALFRDWPMVVLAAGNTDPEVAWLCAALLDNHRATIVGEPALRREAAFHETVSLPGGEWSIQMATGRLLRGDGRPLVLRSTKGPGREAIAEFERSTRESLETRKPASSEEVNQLLEQLVKSSSNATDRAESVRKQSRERDLAKAREILAEALKSIK